MFLLAKSKSTRITVFICTLCLEQIQISDTTVATIHNTDLMLVLQE